MPNDKPKEFFDIHQESVHFHAAMHLHAHVAENNLVRELPKESRPLVYDKPRYNNDYLTPQRKAVQGSSGNGPLVIYPSEESETGFRLGVFLANANPETLSKLGLPVEDVKMHGVYRATIVPLGEIQRVRNRTEMKNILVREMTCSDGELVRDKISGFHVEKPLTEKPKATYEIKPPKTVTSAGRFDTAHTLGNMHSLNKRTPAGTPTH